MFLVFPLVVLGATLYFVPAAEEIYEGDVFLVEIRLDSEDEPINVVQAAMSFSPEALEVISIKKTGSILRFWPDEPAFSNTLGIASFTGGLPNPGFRDSSGLINVITFKAGRLGNTELSFNKTSQVLLNNGLGQKVSLDLKSTLLEVLAPPEGYKPKSVTPIADTTAPDAFTPIISQTDLAFDGKYFVIFETQDLESGISHYEAQELKDDKWGEWKVAVSPYVLENQEGKVRVFIKALDNAGNETIGTAEINISKKGLLNYLIIISIIVFLGLVLRKFIQKFIRYIIQQKNTG